MAIHLGQQGAVPGAAVPIRDQMVEFLRRELVGPDPVPGSVQLDGEEILKQDGPRLRYGAGVLFPRAAPVALAEEAGPEAPPEDAGIDDAVIGDDDGDQRRLAGTEDQAAAPDDPQPLANAYLPSAMGLSFLVRPPERGLAVSVEAGFYERQNARVVDGNGVAREHRHYYRKPLKWQVDVPAEVLLGHARRWRTDRPAGEPGNGLSVRVLSRPFGDGGDRLVTVSVVNDRIAAGGRASDTECFFQVAFSITGSPAGECFLEYPERPEAGADAEEQSLALLYRHRKTYAVGHGCAAEWEATNEGASRVRTEVVPTYEVKPIEPTKLDGLDLRMHELSDEGAGDPLPTLRGLCGMYEAWIAERQDEVQTLPERHQDAANHHLAACRACLVRMRGGIEVLNNDANAMQAFRLANRAMLRQQLHYALPLREWVQGPNGMPVLQQPYKVPDYADPPVGKGAWYPFQLAFILLNLRSVVEPDCVERNAVDLIWFPTGGGKSEAYLGLAAFTILYRRLSNPENGGTTVLTRYTLRLLTAQQFERASALICALEMIRRDNEDALGPERITIGLWVGKTVTPATRAAAVTELNQLQHGQPNRFVVLRCPWCGARMGPLALNGAPWHHGAGDAQQAWVMGYEQAGRPQRVIFRCKDGDCAFGKAQDLPLMVVDEDVYASPPTLLFGTVDKFAMLPWKPEARALFGVDRDCSPPDLIIQDELHLISGPLGSMVGHYETVIQALCSRRGIGPKVVASTATISRADEQCRALYASNDGMVQVFPPPGLIAGNSFFAYEVTDAPGRLYLGVHASALPSHVTAQIRVLAALLQSPRSAQVENEAELDPYWTLVAYFNSLRELGHADTLLRADIAEYLRNIWLREGIPPAEDGQQGRRRYVNHTAELTSRMPGQRIPEMLQQLKEPYGAPGPIDVCLATNMLSVGVDIPRLGLMAVVGQPKTTSEYIQATSRVGRGTGARGLVVVIYNTAKPRDRSHYEHFRSYHQAFYRYVEPSSVTPFAAPVRDRALHALMVTMVRCWWPDHRPGPDPVPDADVFGQIRQGLEARARLVDPEEANRALELFDGLCRAWDHRRPTRYGDFGPVVQATPLMYPAGSQPHQAWVGLAWATPSSMRQVDATCEAQPIAEYPNG